MTDKHTPGPWGLFYIHGEDGALDVWEVGAFNDPADPFSGEADVLFSAVAGGEEVEATIRLAAAAPLMLDALRDALAYLESECPQESTDDCTSCALICYDARAAIAAATGEDA